MPSTWVLTTYGKALGAVPYGIADEWETTLKSMRAAILHALRTTKIPTQTDFNTKLANPSSTRFADFLATVGADWTVADIELKQKAKLLKAWTSWKTNVDAAFQVGGAFETQVTAKKGKTDKFVYPLGMVGNRGEDRWRCASLVALALGGDKRIVPYITSPDTLTNPENLCAALKTPYNWYDRPFIVAAINKYGVLMNYADEVALSKTTLLSSLNAILDEIEGHKVTGSTLTLTATWDADFGTKIVADYTAPP